MKWSRHFNWHHWSWQAEENLLAEFDQMEYSFVHIVDETGHEAIKRLMGIDSNARNVIRKIEGTEEDFQAQFRPPFSMKGE